MTVATAGGCIPMPPPQFKSLLDDAESVEADQRWHDLVANIRATGVHQPTLPSDLQAELRDYQREGFEWLSRLARLEMGACLADDMGLGGAYRRSRCCWTKPTTVRAW